MPVVVDASFVLGSLLPDEGTPLRRAALVSALRQGASAPAHRPAEIGNALLAAHRRGRIGADDLAEALAIVGRLPVRVRAAPRGREAVRVIDLARAHGLSAYDAQYLHLAAGTGAGLATLDRRLRASAAAEGVPLHGDPIP